MSLWVVSLIRSHGKCGKRSSLLRLSLLPPVNLPGWVIALWPLAMGEKLAVVVPAEVVRVAIRVPLA